MLKGIDIRHYGSGNMGATNAMRVLGKKVGISVLLIDILKGFLAVLFIGSWCAQSTSIFSSELTRLLIGVSSILGHTWTVFLKFKGGKGIATTLGVFLAMAIKIKGLGLGLGLVLLIWILVFVLSRIVSLASIIASISFPLIMLIFKQSQILFFVTLLVALFVIYKHKSNVHRLLQRKEPRLKFK